MDILEDFIWIIFSSQTFSYAGLNYQRDLSLLSGLPGPKPKGCSTFPVDIDQGKAALIESQIHG